MNARACLILALGLTACASAPPPQSVPPPSPAPVQAPPAPPPQPAPVAPCPPAPVVLDLLEYYQRVRLMGAAELQREQQALQAVATTLPRDVYNLQMAMLAIQSRSASDWARVQPQLETVARGRDDSPAGLRALAALLLAGQADIRRLEDQGDKLAQQLRDEQKRREAAEAREAALQEKLEGIKAIERNLLNRPQGK